MIITKVDLIYKYYITIDLINSTFLKTNVVKLLVHCKLIVPPPIHNHLIKY